jgi:hypothetical protein
MVTKTSVMNISLYDLIRNNLMLIVAILYYGIVLYTNNNNIKLLDEILPNLNIKEFQWLETSKLTINVSQNIHLLELIILFVSYNFTSNTSTSIGNNSLIIILNWYVCNIINTCINVYYLDLDNRFTKYNNLIGKERLTVINSFHNNFPKQYFTIGLIETQYYVCFVIFILFPSFILAITLIDLLVNKCIIPCIYHASKIYMSKIITWTKEYKIQIINKIEVEEDVNQKV